MRLCLKSPALRLFTQPFIQAQIKENIKAPRHWPLYGEFTGDRWIPRINGQWRGKCFHLMTSSYNMPMNINYTWKESVELWITWWFLFLFVYVLWLKMYCGFFVVVLLDSTKCVNVCKYSYYNSRVYRIAAGFNTDNQTLWELQAI